MSERVACVVLCVLFVLCNTVMMEATVNDRYTREAVVVEVDGTIISAEDNSGNVWCYEVEGDAPCVGSTVDVHMYTNHTDGYIYDDEIVDVVVH